MGYQNSITDVHLDLLKEIGNIGAGNAATSLSKLLNKKIDMKVPKVRMISFDEMMDMAGGADNIVVTVFLRIEGDAPGSMFFLLPLEQATVITRKMINDDSFAFEHPPYSEIGLSAMQELGNILTGSYLTSLSDFTKLKLYPSVPALSVDMVGAVLSFGLIEISQMGDHVIVIDTSLKEIDSSDSSTIKGQFFLLPDPDSFSPLFHALGVK